MKIVVFLALLVPSSALGECLTHTVVKGDTLGSISHQWFGTSSRWKEVRDYNDLQKTGLVVGTNVGFYVPDEDDWVEACFNIMLTRLDHRNVLDRMRNVIVIPEAIENINWKQELNLPASEKLRLCRVVLAVAEQESLYQFRVGGVGEIGIFQLRLSTFRHVLAIYDQSVDENTDEQLVTHLLTPVNAIETFLKLFIYLEKKAGSLSGAFYSYNGSGPHAKRYSREAMQKYYEISRIKPLNCVEEVQ
jgi:hypothetical protein